MGRPTDCTPEVIAKIDDLLSSGCTIKDTCAMVGIDQTTFRNWRIKGEAGEEPFLTFFKSAREARGRGRCAKVKMIEAAGFEDWKAAAWLLERGDPKNWAPQSKLKQEVSGPNKGPVQIAATMAEAGKIAEAIAILEGLTRASAASAAGHAPALPTRADGDSDGVSADG